MLRSLRTAGAKNLVRKHKGFLNKEIKKYFDTVIDKNTGLVRKDMHFSSMKDHSLRQSSCYDNIMTAVVSEESAKLGLDSPFKKYDFRKIIKKNFWNGRYFLDDLSGGRYVAGDANVFPFWTGIFSSRKMLKSSLNAVQNSGLDKPFPLKYAKSPKIGKRDALFDFFAKNYEGNSVWTHMGPLYISLVKRVDKDKYRLYKEQYKKLIEKHKNYLELFTPEGKPYGTLFYHADDSMLWAANYLAL
jgi:hypothetical protein